MLNFGNKLLSRLVIKQSDFDEVMHFQPMPGSQPEEVQEPGETSWNYAEVFADGVGVPVDTFLGMLMQLDVSSGPTFNQLHPFDFFHPGVALPST